MKKETLASPIIPGYETVSFSVKTNLGRLDPLGREIVDGRPMAPPLGYKKTESLAEQIRRMVQDEHIRRELEKSGIETFDEANDFNVGDDFDPTSPYEQHFSDESFEAWLSAKNAENAANSQQGAGNGPTGAPAPANDPSPGSAPANAPPPQGAVQALPK